MRLPLHQPLQNALLFLRTKVFTVCTTCWLLYFIELSPIHSILNHLHPLFIHFSLFRPSFTLKYPLLSIILMRIQVQTLTSTPLQPQNLSQIETSLSKLGVILLI